MQLQTEQVLAALKVAVPIPDQPTPFLYWAAATTTVLVAVQAEKKRRAAFVPIIAASLFGGLIHAPTAFHEFSWCYDWGLFMVIFFLYSMHKLFIDARVPSSPKGSVLDRRNWFWAYKTISERGIATTGSRTNRLSFLIGRLASMFVIGAVLNLVPHILFPGFFEPLSMDEFDSEHQSYFRRLILDQGPAITARETAMRCAFVLLTGGGTALELIQCHNLLSIVSVCILFLDRPEDWPTFFSAPTRIRSLRSFWSRFWHRVIVRTYAGIAGCFSAKVLRLKPHGELDRVVVHSLVFSISGAVHYIVSWAFGQHCETWRDWAWFAGTYPAIVVEDWLLAAVGWSATRFLRAVRSVQSTQSEERFVGSIKTVTGLLYLFMWFFWSVPKLYYPKTYCLPGAFS